MNEYLEIDKIIAFVRLHGGSDIHITEGLPMMIRVDGSLKKLPFQLTDQEIRVMILKLLNEKQQKQLLRGLDVDFAVQTETLGRQRIHVFWQRRKLAATIRLLNLNIPTLDDLQLPDILKELVNMPSGLILITGPAGSGKSTTLAAMIEQVNQTQPQHIITIEDPIEYVFQSEKALIHQREVGSDTASFASALRSALREDPDVIMVGEMRDYETISAALAAAETGHLVISTLHTTGAAQTIDRIIDACPFESQNQIRTQLAGVLSGIVTQLLIPADSGQGRILAAGILIGTEAVLNLIRENKCHQLNTVMQGGGANGMQTLNSDLARLVLRGMITADNAKKYSNNKKELEHYLIY